MTIYLFDYDVKVLQILLDYVSTGIGECDNEENYSNMVELLNQLKIKSIKESVNIKSELTEMVENNEIENHKSKKDHSCHVCGKEFKTDRALVIHFKNVHPKDRPFFCDNRDCGGAVFNLRHQLRYHIKQVHQNMSKKPLQPYKCDECHRRYSTLNMLKYHKKLHEEEEEDDNSFEEQLTNEIKMEDHDDDDDNNFENDPLFVNSKSKNVKEVSVVDIILGKHDIKKCYICNLDSKTDNELILHFKQIHPEDRPFQCNDQYCDKTFSLRHQQRYHIKNVHHKILNCYICERGFRNKMEIVSHFKTSHPNNDPFICKECGTGFTKGHDLCKHMWHVHNFDKMKTSKDCAICIQIKNKPFENLRGEEKNLSISCHECGNVFTQKHELCKHMWKVHNYDKTSTSRSCKICLKSKRNETRNETLPRIYNCPNCPSRFKHVNILRSHMALHGPREHTCETCGKQFRQKSNLSHHVKTQHSGLPKTVKCNICNKQFGSFKEVRNHAKTHSKDDVKARYVCVYCGESYMCLGSMKNHQRKYHNVGQQKHYKCKICEKTVENINAMRWHISADHQSKFKTFTVVKTLL